MRVSEQLDRECIELTRLVANGRGMTTEQVHYLRQRLRALNELVVAMEDAATPVRRRAA